MKDTIRVVHCGDVHLGAGRQIHEDRYGDLFRVFQEAADAAVGADLLLISGDLFDAKEPDPETLARTVAILRKLQAREGAPQVVAIEGNHDMRKQARGAYKNTKGVLDVFAEAGLLALLRPERVTGDDVLDFSGAVYALPDTDVSVLGLGYWRDNTAARFREATAYAAEHLAGRRVIVLAHLMLTHEGLEPYHGSALVSELGDVPGNVIYVGLGHGHGRIGPGHERHAGIFYSPGSLEFIHSRNTSKPTDTRGFFDVSITKDGVEAVHRPTMEKRPFLHREITLTVENAPSFSAVKALVLARFRADLGDRGDRGDRRELRPILSVLLSGRIGFAASEFRSSLINMELRRELDALQVFVRRAELTDAAGAPLVVDVREGYSDALKAGLAGLVNEHRAELGLGEDDAVLVPSLLEAIRSKSGREAELERIRAHLRAKRPAAPVVPECRVDVSGLDAGQIAAGVAAALAEHAGEEAVRVVLEGEPLVDADGLPVDLDLAAWAEGTRAGPTRLILEIAPEMYAPSNLLSGGGAR